MKTNYAIKILFFVGLLLNLISNLSFANPFSLEELSLNVIREEILKEVFNELSNNQLRSPENFLYETNLTYINEQFFEKIKNNEKFSQIVQDKILNPQSKIIQVEVVGNDNDKIIVLLENGSVYSFNLDYYKQKNLTQNLTSLLKEIDFFSEKIIQISVGSRHVLALSQKGNVYSFGSGRGGRLGHGDPSDQTLPKKIILPDSEKIVKIACGLHHSILLNSEGKIYTFGFGHLGMLGHGDDNDQFVPKKVEALSKEKIIQVEGGGEFTLVLNNKGKVFSFGVGEDGALGHGNKENQLLPKEIESLSHLKIKSISVGENHSLVLSDQGKVYSFGFGLNGRLGHRNENDQLLPKNIKFLTNNNIIKIIAGSSYSLAISNDNKVFFFGNGNRINFKKENQKKILIPQEIENLSNKKSIQIFANKYFIGYLDKAEIFLFHHKSSEHDISAHTFNRNIYIPLDAYLSKVWEKFKKKDIDV